jgi:hypothetical protein
MRSLAWESEQPRRLKVCVHPLLGGVRPRDCTTTASLAHVPQYESQSLPDGQDGGFNSIGVNFGEGVKPRWLQEVEVPWGAEMLR